LRGLLGLIRDAALLGHAAEQSEGQVEVLAGLVEVVVQSGGLVTSWNDKASVPNNVTQGTPANQPTYVAGALGGNAVVRFDDLSDETVLQIVGKAIREFQALLAPKGISLEVTDECARWLARKGYSKEFGAREISRLVSAKIKDFFVDEILFGRLKSGGRVRIECRAPERNYGPDTLVKENLVFVFAMEARA
jgi:hypothetical protein